MRSFKMMKKSRENFLYWLIKESTQFIKFNFGVSRNWISVSFHDCWFSLIFFFFWHIFRRGVWFCDQIIQLRALLISLSFSFFHLHNQFSKIIWLFREITNSKNWILHHRYSTKLRKTSITKKSKNILSNIR